MADNPTRRLADQSRASYEKVAQAQSERTQVKEAALGRFQEGVARGAGMMQQQAQADAQLEAQKEESQARLGQQKQQFEAGQSLEREQMAQQKALRERDQSIEIQKAAAQRTIQNAQLEQGDRELAQRQLEQQQEHERALEKERRMADEFTAEQRVKREEHLNKRRDYYREEVGKLRSAKEKLLFSKNDQDLNSNMTSLIASKLGQNAQFKGGAEQLLSGQASPEVIKQMSEAIDNYTVKTMVDQAQELGEWAPPPNLVQHPDVQRMQSFMGEAQNAFNSMFQRQLLSALQEGNERQLAELRTLHADPEERDRRIARTASRAMRVWYRTRNARDAAGAIQSSEDTGFGQRPR